MGFQGHLASFVACLVTSQLYHILHNDLGRITNIFICRNRRYVRDNAIRHLLS